MASKIEWTDETWNPVVGCQIVSPGCTNCYAMKMAGRLQAMGAAPHYAGTVRKTKAGFVWTGKMAPAPEHVLLQPLRWRRPRRIFVNSMGDLFADGVPSDLVDRVFAVMALAPQHQYQLLSKRPDRMREYVSGNWQGRILKYLERWQVRPAGHGVVLRTVNGVLPYVWLGASVEDQQRADLRRAAMAEIAGLSWNTFVSYEPALGEVDWSGWEFIRWLIAGGESGCDARPVHPDWIRIARDFCAEHWIMFFFKQWGEWAPGEANSFRKTLAVRGAHLFDDRWDYVSITAAEGAEMHCEDEPDVWRIGKRHSGRLLDGVEHNAMPEVAHV